MALDREEEAKRQYEYAQNPQAYQRQQTNNQQFVGTAPAAEISAMPDMSDIPGPTNKRRMQAAAQRDEEEDGGWGGAAADLLD